LKNADVIILAGVVCDFRLDYGNTLNRNAVVISANRDIIDLYKNRRPTLAVHSDACFFLIELEKALAKSKSSTNWSEWMDTLNKLEKLSADKFDKHATEETNYVNPLFLCQQIEKAADPKTIIVADGGDFVGTASYSLHPRNPLSWLDPGAFGTLGVGGGFAIGAKLCKPDHEVWLIWGDGACGFSLSEYDTMVRHGINVIAVVGNDAAWSQILREQRDIFQDDTGCILAYTNYHQCAIGFGAEGLIVQDKTKVEDIFKQAKELAKKKPVLVNALIGSSDFRKGSLSM